MSRRPHAHGPESGLRSEARRRVAPPSSARPRIDSLVRLEHTCTELAVEHFVSLDDMPTSAFEEPSARPFADPDADTPPLSSRALPPAAPPVTPHVELAPTTRTRTSSLPPKLDVPLVHAREALSRALADARAVWAATEETPEPDSPRLATLPAPLAALAARAAWYAARLRVAWGTFEWTRADYARAALIGGVTFAVLALLVLVPLAASSASSDEGPGHEHVAQTEVVRAERTAIPSVPATPRTPGVRATPRR